MNLLELVRLAFGRLRTSRLRSALTMLGVIIGVASVVALVSVGQGATAGITSQIQALGTNLLTVNPGSSTSGLTNLGVGTADTLTLDDATRSPRLRGIAAVAPQITTSQLVIARQQEHDDDDHRHDADYATRAQRDALPGRVPERRVRGCGSLRVAVLGATTATDLGLTRRRRWHRHNHRRHSLPRGRPAPAKGGIGRTRTTRSTCR